VHTKKERDTRKQHVEHSAHRCPMRDQADNHDDIVSEIVKVGIASAARMLLLLSKRSPRERERRELREIESGGGINICHSR